jgi:hypothetical protein
MAAMQHQLGAQTAAAVQEPVVPLGALQQFLAAIRARDFEGAKALAFQSKLHDPAAVSQLPTAEAIPWPAPQS